MPTLLPSMVTVQSVVCLSGLFSLADTKSHFILWTCWKQWLDSQHLSFHFDLANTWTWRKLPGSTTGFSSFIASWSCKLLLWWEPSEAYRVVKKRNMSHVSGFSSEIICPKQCGLPLSKVKIQHYILFSFLLFVYTL